MQEQGTVTHARKGGIIVVGLALTSLTLVAANRLDAALWVFVASGAGIVISVLAWAYERLPKEARSRFAGARFLLITGTISLAAASILSSSYWFIGWRWFSPPTFMVDFMRALDFVPSAFSLFLPAAWRSGFHLYFTSIPYCFPGPFWWESMRYLREAIPAYTFLFIAGAVLFRLVMFNVATHREPRAN